MHKIPDLHVPTIENIVLEIGVIPIHFRIGTLNTIDAWNI